VFGQNLFPEYYIYRKKEKDWSNDKMECRFRMNALVSGVDQKCGVAALTGWVQELIALLYGVVIAEL
jgi:hypothetical protein